MRGDRGADDRGVLRGCVTQFLECFSAVVPRSGGDPVDLEDGTRSLATVLFTDIVDSTAGLQSIGDAAWRELLAVHNARLREQRTIFRGREVKTTGDGFFATFDSPTRAVHVLDPRRARSPWRPSSTPTRTEWSRSGSVVLSSRRPVRWRSASGRLDTLGGRAAAT